ncbi:PREDICTED: SH3 domain-binding glutamic acid-rich-like protein 3 [Aptenodytes forsteri]|uniref:SH3 domain-binding glutamic acid-rich-like protein 3 n=1 Tax=Aptenodytes forsteri TaxID=9233 RepID=UPI0004F44F12|nr:PREDICTED: SH3 domain-binding glutamic acid-rich-like protein 3 [Aptenodytes forsteri]
MAAETPSRPMLGASRLALSQQLGCPAQGRAPWPGGVWTVARKERSLCERCAERGWHAGVRAHPSGSSPVPRNLPFPPGFQIKSQQSEVTRILDGKNIKYELVDISQDNALREEMRAKAGNPKAIPPQIVNGDHYCGDYELFVEAVEQNTLQEFLKLA